MRFALALFCLSLPALGCGGSSSETPPPLLPDPTSARYTGPRMPNAADDVAAPAPAEPEVDDAADQPRRPAATTWGSGKTPTSAPKMTSPTALPPPPSASAVPGALPAAN
jgi:hypothetical protein